MKKYRVEVPYIVTVTAIVEAENEDEAIDAAFDEGAELTGYCGNGGSNKLVGVYGSNLSVDAWDEYYENESDDIGISVEEVQDETKPV